MLFFIQDRLIQMGHAPSLGNIKIKKFRKLYRCFFGNGIPPGTERHHQLSLFIESHIAMHHGADTKRSHLCQSHAVFGLHILCHFLIAVLQAVPDILQAVGPDIIFITVFPFMVSRGDRSIILSYQHSLDSGGSEFNT